MKLPRYTTPHLVTRSLSFTLLLFLAGCFGGEENAIRKQLKKVEETLSFRPGDGNMGTLTKMKAMEGLFTEDVSVKLRLKGAGSHSVEGLKPLQKLSFALRPQAGKLDASLRELEIEVDEGALSATVEAKGMAIIEGEIEPITQDFILYLEKIEGIWLIKEATTVY